MRAYWKFYQDVTVFNVAFCIIAGLISGLVWMPILFCTIGVLIGMLGYHTFYKQQYYFYYNLGYTKVKLAGITFFINLIIAIPLLLLILIFK